MRTGVTYLGDLNPKHITTDIQGMTALGLDDVLVAIQENDFVHFPGKMRFTSEIARDFGIRPIAIFWGALNLFGGGRSSQFLLDHPEGHQVGRNGAYRPEGCYMNPVCVDRIKQMLDTAASLGYAGYFIDEPTPLPECYCPSCRRQYREWYDEDLAHASDEDNDAFRRRCVVSYIKTVADYCKSHHPMLETITCLMPTDRSIWQPAGEIDTLDNLGTDIYWVNEPHDVEEMTPIVNQIGGICKRRGKIHHEWLQCWAVKKGRERRILEQGEILVRQRPDALYVWAWKGQIGTAETCEDPEAAWRYACEVLIKAKQV